FHLRQEAGENPSAAEYERRFRVDPTDWPRLASVSGDAHDVFHQQTACNLGKRGGPASDRAPEAAEPGSANERGGSSARPASEAQRPPLDTAKRLAQGLAALPEVGTDFLGFQLLEELGRGTFGRVYLARQRDLAHRFVALKITTDTVGEPQTLAQLQHTN